MPSKSLLQRIGMPQLKRLNSHGLTSRQEAFAQLVSRGKALSEAYRETYKAGGQTTTVNVSASKLAKNPKVKARIDMLLEQQEAAMHRDSVAIRRHVFSSLMKESRDMTSKASERISALIALGKIDIVSMFREVHSHEERTERRPEEVESELRSKLERFVPVRCQAFAPVRATERARLSKIAERVSSEIMSASHLSLQDSDYRHQSKRKDVCPSH